MSDAPVTLAYDDLPPGSDIIREYGDDGAVTIKVMAGEPTRAALRPLLQASALSGAVVAGVLLTGGVLIVGSATQFNRLPSSLRVSGAIVFGVFCLALVAFMWRLRFVELRDRLHRTRRQSTILHARPGRLIIETAGPYGDASHDLSASEIESVDVDAGRRLARFGAIDLRLKERGSLRILRGRDPHELRWIVGQLLQAMQSTSNDRPRA